MEEARGIHRRIEIEVTESLKRRFFDHLPNRPESECWNWVGALRSGYGALKNCGRVISAHRLSYIIHKGNPADGEVIRHSCDNRKCCNPAHLEAGTPKQNVDDMRRRVQVVACKGEANPNAVLSDPVVRAIRWMYGQGLGPHKIARELGIKKGTVSGVLYCGKWSHVTSTESSSN